MDATGQQQAFDKKCKENHNDIKEQSSQLNKGMLTGKKRGDIFENKDAQMTWSIVLSATGR